MKRSISGEQMKKLTCTFWIPSILVIFSLITPTQNYAQNPQRFNVNEITISEVHEAIRSGVITCRSLIEAYVARINKFDQPSRLNSIILINPEALADADRLDREFEKTGKLRPLHGIPIIVKDNYDTKDLQTTGGSLALKGSLPPDDAFQVRKLREAGAVVFAKSNMAEWAFSPMVTISSIAGITRNPYDLSRVPAGSSGGTGAAVASNFGTVGLGTDTGNSIRGPSSHNGLVGIRSTMGLTSRDGIIPLYRRNDIGGPMARTVEDAVRILDVIAGYDPADPITEGSVGKTPDSYLTSLKKGGLKGARLGVFRYYIDSPDTDPEIKALTQKAIEDLIAQGAVIIDPFDIPDFTSFLQGIWCNTFYTDINTYLSTLGDRAPYKTIDEIVASGLYSPYVENNLKRNLESGKNPEPCPDLFHREKNIIFRDAVSKAMDTHNIDAIIYPTWSNPPRKIGDLESPAGDNSQHLAPHTGFPAITVPMGHTQNVLPAGLTFVGRLFSEPDLISFVYDYEQTTRHRKPPAIFPALK
jgi:amidase